MTQSRAWIRRGGLLVLLVVGGAARPGSVGAAPEYPPVRYENYQRTYPSGLRVVSYRFTWTRLASVAVSVLGGVQAEPEGKEGVAEIVTRLLSGQTGRSEGDEEGTPARPSVGQRLLAVASEFEATAGRDSILLTARSVPGKLDEVLALEGERLRDPLAGVGPDDLARIRAALLEELAGTEASPGDDRVRWEVLRSVMPVGVAWPRAATRGSVSSIEWSDVVGYVAANFRPERVIVVVVGPVPGRAVESAIDRGFGPGLLVRPVPTAASVWNSGAPFEESWRDRALVVVPGPVRSPRLWMAWEMPGIRSKGEVVSAIAAGMAAVRLGEASKKLGKPGRLSFDELGGSAILAVTAEVESEEDARKLLSAFSLASGGDAAVREIAAGREKVAKEFYLQLEVVDAATVARFVRVTDELDPLDAMRMRLGEPLPAGIGDRVRRLLGPGQTMAVLQVPATAGKGADGGRAVDDHGAPDAEEGAGRSAPWIYRLPPGKYDVYAIAQPPGLSGAWRERLGNGLEVVGLPRPGYPKMVVKLVVRDTDDVPATLPPLALSALRPPPGSRCERVEGHLEPGAAVWTSMGFAGHLSARAETLACSVAFASVDKAAFEKSRDGLYAAAKKVDKAHSGSALRAETAAQAMLAQGRAALQRPRAGDIDDLEWKQADAWARTNLRPDRATLVLVGDIPSQEDAMFIVGVRLGGWSTEGRPPVPAPPPPARPPTRRAVFHAEHDGRKTTVVVVSVPWSPATVRDEVAESVVMDELGRRLRRTQGSGARRPRVERGRSSAFPTLQVTFDVASERTGEATRRVLEVIATQAEAPALAENVAFFRWFQASRYPLLFADLKGVGERFVEQERRGLPAEWWDRYPAAISGLGTQRVEEASARLLAGKEVVLVLGDDEKSLASLRAAGFTVERP